MKIHKISFFSVTLNKISILFVIGRCPCLLYILTLANNTMTHLAVRRLLLDWEATDLVRKISLASSISKEGFRSDTLFKKLCREILEPQSHSSMQPQLLAQVLNAMDRLRMGSGSTSWWDRERDYKLLADRLQQSLSPSEISGMSAEQLAECTSISTIAWTDPLAEGVFDRMRFILGEGVSETNPNQQYLANIVSNLTRRNKKCVSHDDQLWLAEWLCANVYLMSVHDVATINRCLVNVGFRSHEYHKIWVPYYLERLEELNKDDIATISETFNAVGMSDTLLGGRHFFYKLGKRFQELTVSANGDKEVNQTKKYRNLLQRLG